MTYPLGENRRNPAKKHKTVLEPNHKNNKHNMLLVYKRGKKHDKIQIYKKLDMNNRKRKIIHPPPSEESHPVTDHSEKTVKETGD